MAGNINNLLTIILLFFLGSCQNLKKTNENKEVYISIIRDINYNVDILEYYVVNKTDKDLKILCNPNFFKREKDSLFLNAIPNPKIKIYNHEKLVNPIVLNVNYTSKVLDSLSKIKEKYVEINSTNKVEKLQLNVLKNYIKTIKKNDSIRFLTKINFENEPRFYDYSENEGYILKENKSYYLEICLNENLNEMIKTFLEKENIYSQKICSKRKKLNFIKTNYSE